jgi:hypothetical protein
VGPALAQRGRRARQAAPTSQKGPLGQRVRVRVLMAHTHHPRGVAFSVRTLISRVCRTGDCGTAAFFTVRSEQVSFAAISAVARPSASRRSTSVSRWVRLESARQKWLREHPGWCPVGTQGAVAPCSPSGAVVDDDLPDLRSTAATRLCRVWPSFDVAWPSLQRSPSRRLISSMRWFSRM